MESRTDDWIRRTLIVGFVEEELIYEANSNNIQYIQIFV